jgi:hypothetical protein
MKKKLIAFYLDWTNNWLTISAFAEHYGLSEFHAQQLIEIGRQLHEEQVANP